MYQETADLTALTDRIGTIGDAEQQGATGFSSYLEQEIVELSDEVLTRIGFDHVVATSELHDRDLRQVLTTLRKENVAHTWRKYDVAHIDCAAELTRLENEKRPTLIIGYYGVNHDGSYALLAVGTIAERVARDFAHGGFPVVARCCINPDYRQRGLYRIVLNHRIDLCFRFWGSDLKGIHLGTSNPRVQRVLENFRQPRVTGFSLIGTERLGLGKITETVGAYMLLTKRYARDLLRSPRTDKRMTSPALQQQIVELLEQFVLTGFSEGEIHELRARYEGNQLLWRSMESTHPVRQLLDFARSLTLV